MRLFVALEIPPAWRTLLAGAVGAWRSGLPGTGAPPARWVRPEAWHVTLAFLGEVPASSLPALSDALAPAFAAHRPFRLGPAAGGTFPPGRPARVLWLGLEDEPAGALAALQETVVAFLSSIGHARDERPFHGHLTLARCARPWPRPAVERFLERSSRPPGEPFEVRQGVLFESHLSPAGPRYRPLTAFPLAVETRP